NTLAQFAGYLNWRDFKNDSTNRKQSWVQRKINPNLGIIITSASLMTLVFVSFYSMVTTNGSSLDTIDLSKITFSSRPISQGIPNSVVFDFDIEELKSDSIYIQQFWDPTKTIKIKRNQNQATGIYYFPGYFRAKLLVDGKSIKEHDLFIKSEHWLATLDYRPVPKYLKGSSLLNGNLSLPTNIIEEVKSNESPLVSSFHFIKDFGDISGDNFTLKTTVRNVYNEKWAVCQSIRIVILGTKGAMVIPFSISGCVSDIRLLMNDVSLSGKEHDLSAFGADFSTFRNVDIHIRDKNVAVAIDGIEIYSGGYNASMGELVGIRYRFLGAGEVANLWIRDELKKKVVMDDDFNPKK
ncbi:MAG: hypothetical protein WBG90_00770, partial [Saonia sp.]